MKKNTLVLVSALTLLLLTFACKAKKIVESSVPADSYIVIGQGGGFTGKYIQFKINGDGKIEEFNFSNESYSQIAQLKATEVSGYFDRIDSLSIGEMDVINPGNMSQYLEVNYKDIKNHKLIWPMKESAIKENIQSFYTDCYTFCSEQKSISTTE